MIDEIDNPDTAVKNDKPKKLEKFSRLKSPPPPVVTTLDSSDEDHNTSNQLSEILGFMKTIQNKLEVIEDKYDALHNDIAEVRIKLDENEVKEVIQDIIKRG